MDDILSRMGSLATNDEPRPFRHTSTHWRAACGEGPGGRSLFGDRGRDDGARSFGGDGVPITRPRKRIPEPYAAGNHSKS